MERSTVSKASLPSRSVQVSERKLAFRSLSRHQIKKHWCQAVIGKSRVCARHRGAREVCSQRAIASRARVRLRRAGARKRTSRPTAVKSELRAGQLTTRAFLGIARHSGRTKSGRNERPHHRSVTNKELTETTRGSAKPLCVGSIPTRASTLQVDNSIAGSSLSV
jgi:hypothetical protein